MRVLVFNDKKPERDAMMRVLQQASLTVEAVADAKAAVAAITREPPSVLILSWPAGNGAADTFRLVRGADPLGQMYVVALLDGVAGGRDIATPVAAGVHDFLRRPIVDAELVARVQAPERRIRWAKLVSQPKAFDLTGGNDVSKLAVWKGLGDVIAADL